MTDGVVIAGGGLAAQRCSETLRRCGYEGRITLVCAEGLPPYDRPPLSKAVLHSADVERSLTFRPDAWYREQDVQLVLDTRVTALDPARLELRLGDGSRLRAGQVLIATGSRPRVLPALANRTNVMLLRTLEDARRLRVALQSGGHLAIVGAGFIGLEVAAAARAAGVEVTIVEAAATPLAHILGRRVGEWFAALHRREGVEMLLGRTVARALGQPSVEALVLDDGTTVRCDHVLVAVGVEPDLAWLADSGLPLTGIPVDDGGETSIPGVFAAGDAAAPFDAVLERHVCGAHWEAAGRMGARAARGMLGLDPGAPPPSSFWSDQYGIRIQYLGHAVVADDLSVDGDLSARDFEIVFTRERDPVGALLVGRPQRLPEMRRLLSRGQGAPA